MMMVSNSSRNYHKTNTTFRCICCLCLILCSQFLIIVQAEECRLTPVFHVLQSPGCNPMTIPSFACVGKCTSYVQVSASKMWQIERSCMCCQESGEREATVTLSCPKAQSGSMKIQKVKVVTKAPVDCMCRPCTGVDEGSVLPQEMAGYLEADGSSPAFSVFPVRFQL